MKKEARQRGGKLRVVLNRISHPSLTRIRIDLGHQYKSNQQLPIPETVAHVFSDILENSERQKKIILGPVQTITKDAFISNKIKDIGKNKRKRLKVKKQIFSFVNMKSANIMHQVVVVLKS